MTKLDEIYGIDRYKDSPELGNLVVKEAYIYDKPGGKAIGMIKHGVQEIHPNLLPGAVTTRPDYLLHSFGPSRHLLHQSRLSARRAALHLPRRG